ncbi:hypothetical protein ACFU5O_37090 [Streptomyces sp. NPDC057445]|uniref:hypothetical protein n=1 Tax=Streptomyces sp. NPDC057445 TaxID=3346136 RepID=UPI00368C01C6
MSVHAPASQLAPARTAPATPATFHPRRPTVLSYGLGADSTAILLMFLADPAAHGPEPDLSDLVVVHAITGDEFVDSLDYVNIGKPSYQNLCNAPPTSARCAHGPTVRWTRRWAMRPPIRR